MVSWFLSFAVAFFVIAAGAVLVLGITVGAFWLGFVIDGPGLGSLFAAVAFIASIGAMMSLAIGDGDK